MAVSAGKTHAALAALARAGSGIYCAPLRLLAWEAASRINGLGVPCSLITGSAHVLEFSPTPPPQTQKK